MRNLFIYIAIIVFSSSCTNREKGERLTDFEDVEGMLYYQKPQEGSTVYALFMPYKNDSRGIDFTAAKFFEKGIKFSTANGLIKDKLYAADFKKAILKGGIDREVYVLPKAKIYFHINKPYYTEQNVIDEEIKSDTLIYQGKSLILKYRGSFLVIDSVKAN